MNLDEFKRSVAHEVPPSGLCVPLVALWWDNKGDWTQAHSLVDELETKDGMAVHAYLHRKEGDQDNAGYWYRRVSKPPATVTLAEEWEELARALLAEA